MLYCIAAEHCSCTPSVLPGGQSTGNNWVRADCDVAGQRLRFYCVQCDTAVCSSCTDIEHRDHGTDSLQQAMKTERETMRTSVTDIQDKVPSIKKSIEAIKLTSESLAHKEEDLDDDINDTFDQLVALLEQRRTNLLNQLHFRVASKRDKLGKHQRLDTGIFSRL